MALSINAFFSSARFAQAVLRCIIIFRELLHCLRGSPCGELEHHPTFADALWKRGEQYAAQGDWETAVADYTAAIEVDPGWPWVYLLRAQALAELGRSAEAQADLAQALELNPAEELREQIERLDLGN